jgi:hypothetical protein
MDHAGLAAAAARGRKCGLKPVVDADKLARVRSMVAKGLMVLEAVIRLYASKRWGSRYVDVATHPFAETMPENAKPSGSAEPRQYKRAQETRGRDLGFRGEWDSVLPDDRWRDLIRWLAR